LNDEPKTKYFGRKHKHLTNGMDLKSSLFQCPHCPKTFQLKMTLKLHELSHQNQTIPKPEKPQPKCMVPIYKLTYNSNPNKTGQVAYIKSENPPQESGEDVEVPTSMSNLPKQFQCPLCDFHCLSKKVIILHCKDVHNYEYVFTCLKCKYVGLKAEDYCIHLQTQDHKDNLQRFKNHKDTSSAARPFMCHLCPFRATDRCKLELHLAVHSDAKEYPCPFCSYRGKTDAYLKIHMRSHNTEKKFKCSLCDFASKSPYGLTDHVKKKHVKTTMGEHKCRNCEMRFTEMCELRVHNLLVHGIEHSFFCRHCHFSTKSKKEYQEHLQEHYGPYKFKCDLCDFACRNGQQLKRHHMRRHTDTRAHLCTVCPKTFQEKSDLKRHIATHSNKKPYKCSFCEYTCKFRNTLTLHMKVHSSLKTNRCPHCDYETKYVHNLTKHMLVHEIDLNFMCSMCDFRAATLERVEKHMERIHKGDQTEVY